LYSPVAGVPDATSITGRLLRDPDAILHSTSDLASHHEARQPTYHDTIPFRCLSAAC
jgi:hypothetical protein